MERVSPTQISLDAAPGGRPNSLPVIASLNVSGKIEPHELCDANGEFPQLSHGDEVLVTVSDADGQFIAKRIGTVQIGFEDKDGFTVRQQKVKL